MIDKYKNIDAIENSTGQIQGLFIKPEDEAIFWLGDYQNKKYKSNPTDHIEFSVYDLDNNLLHWEIQRNPPLNIVQPGGGNYSGVAPIIVVKPGESARKAGFSRGTYRITYNLFRSLFGSGDGNKLYIKEISTSRTELRLFPVKTKDGSINSLIASEFNAFSNINPLTAKNTLHYLANFGNDVIVPILNWVVDIVNGEQSVIVKLYEPLPDTVKVKAQLWVVEALAEPTIEKITLLGTRVEPIVGTYLRPANFGIDIDGISHRETPFESWTDIVSTNATTSVNLIDTYLSESKIEGIPLNIDFENYENFIHFSSAKERLDNFKYKLQLIETYNQNITTLANLNGATPDSPHVVANINSNLQRRREIINGFDIYERFLYFESGSAYSSSFGDRPIWYNPDSTWPKTNSTSPYTLAHTTSSEAIAWYATQSAFASAYDNNNIHRLIYNVPAHIRVDVQNEEFTKFVDMVGHFYDNTWLYIKQFSELYQFDTSISRRLSKDLTYHLAKSFGFDLGNGNDYVELWKYALGTDVTGSYISGSLGNSGYGNITKEIWRRLLTNMPYLLKTKGTPRSIKGLMSCYGIPTSFVTIREFGGPDPRDYTSSFNNRSAYVHEDFTHALNFYGSQNVSFDWNEFGGYPTNASTIEVTFKTKHNSIASHSIYSRGTNFGLVLIRDTDNPNLGYVQFKIGSNKASTALAPFYDDEFYTAVVVTNIGSNITLYVKKAVGERFTFVSSQSISYSSLWTSDGTMKIGNTDTSNFGSGFSGSIKEFRIYQPALSESVFDNHIRWPKSYNSNTYTSSYNDLVLRYSFDEPKNHSTDSVVTDTKANQTYSTPGNASGYSTNRIHYSSVTSEFAGLSPSLAGGRLANNKIRIESNRLKYGKLSHVKRSEESEFDLAPVDSNKLGIYFSPTDAINVDIIASFGGSDLTGFLGNPAEMYEDTYSALDDLNAFYWEKYSTIHNFNTFITFIKNFDQSFFDQVRSFIPARANSVLGILIEPHVLERYKVKKRRPTVESLGKIGEIPRITPITLTSSYTYYQGETSASLSNRLGEYIYYVGEVSRSLSSTDYLSKDQQYIGMTPSIQSTVSGTAWREDNHYTNPLTRNTYYNGVLNTKETTVDGNDPVVVYFTNPNRLISTDVGPSKLRVE